MTAWRIRVRGAHADFEEFVRLHRDGKTTFRDQRPTKGRHRDRVWPFRERSKRRKYDPLFRERWWPHWIVRKSRAMDASSLLAARKKWLPCHPLDAWHMMRCDRAQRPPLYDP